MKTKINTCKIMCRYGYYKVRTKTIYVFGCSKSGLPTTNSLVKSYLKFLVIVVVTCNVSDWC